MFTDKNPLNISENPLPSSNAEPQVKISGRLDKKTGILELDIVSVSTCIIQNVVVTDGNATAYVSNLNSKVINTGTNKITGKVYLVFNNPQCTVQIYTDKGVFMGTVQVILSKK
ncbi:hypothetical protein [Stygiolobus caldivivus]|uniref:Uncharacterized protein n=1 Tax=Stygiolobus caldivivus TaxID=2824673 RepID=A0A8D5U7Z5_9CREN|nr:hypothetical protein [Stygiolobus caldivivus]BCU70872.1 hypothetical protein KN1_21690 [Stygiolobus caldivivus]